MSEAITKACNAYRCDGGIRKYTEMPWATCSKCKGTGRVPDVKAALRAKITELSREAEDLRMSAEEWRDKYVAARREIERLKAECETRHAHEVALENEKLRMYDEHSRIVHVANDEAHKNAAWWRAEIEKRDAEVERLKGREAAAAKVMQAHLDGDATNRMCAAWLAGCKS